MPKILWNDLPLSIRDHLLERARERQVSFDDLYRLKEWRESGPEAPDGDWYKDFGSFKLCGQGKDPKTFLPKGQAAKGTPID